MKTDVASPPETEVAVPRSAADPPVPGGSVVASPGRRASRALGVPVASVVIALLVGAVVIAIEGHAPLDVYRSMVEGVTGSRFGWRDTLTRACPVVLIAVGLSFAYRARVYNIGPEGQLLVGATVATAWATGPASSLPGPLLVVTSLALGAVAGAAWAGLAAWFGNRFGASVVISTLLLVYVAEAVLAYAVRVPLKDPTGILPQSRTLGGAELPVFGDVRLHVGVLLAATVAPAAWIGLQRTRFGFRVRAMGYNADALEANELPAARIATWVLLLSGGLAGVAGYIQVAGVQGRLVQGLSPGFGFAAITVALVGRLHPVGVLVSGVLLSAMLIGAESAQREYALPVSAVSMLQALVVVLVVCGDALAIRRWRT